MRADLLALRAALLRMAVARRRLEAKRARTDTREWVMKRRERTRHLIELGGLVVKAGLVDLLDDDRAALYGAFLALAATARSGGGGQATLLWRRRGKRAFEAEAQASASHDHSTMVSPSD